MNIIKLIALCGVLSVLAACAASSGGANSQVYGEIKGGVEHTHVNQ